MQSVVLRSSKIVVEIIRLRKVSLTNRKADKLINKKYMKVGGNAEFNKAYRIGSHNSLRQMKVLIQTTIVTMTTRNDFQWVIRSMVKEWDRAGV